MAATADLYAYATGKAFSGDINWTSDTIKLALVTSSYTMATSDEYWSTPQADEASGAGYTAGGVTLSSCTVTTTLANSWSVSRANSTAYTLGQVVKPSTGNGYLYRCVVAGTSSSSAPTYPTVVGETVTDGGVTWVCAGTSITVYTSSAAQWTSATISAAAGVIYDAESGTASSEPLIALQSFGSTVSSTDGTYEVAADSVHGWFYTFAS